MPHHTACFARTPGALGLQPGAPAEAICWKTVATQPVSGAAGKCAGRTEVAASVAAWQPHVLPRARRVGKRAGGGGSWQGQWAWGFKHSPMSRDSLSIW